MFQAAIQRMPQSAEAYGNLGRVQKEQGLLAAALAAYRTAIALRPDDPRPYSNLLYALHFLPEQDAARLAEEHRRWHEIFARPLAAGIRPHENERAPQRRLRVGYVSPDFREHPVGRFLLPLLEEHDREQFEVTCYSSTRTADATTARCRAAATRWQEIGALSDAQAAALVRQDGIDVLVDLTMHMEDGRPLLFARQPAPVQVTYLAYVGTTGLPTIHCRLTDPCLDPAPEMLRNYTEESVLLPETYWCYQPLRTTPEVTPLPAARNAGVTFGSLNNFCKVSELTLDAWAAILRAVPESRLLLHARPGSHRQRVIDFLAQRGIAAQRVAFDAGRPLDEYLQLYQQIDVALDPFPYGGGTTTCDALWMGCPVVSLAGPTAVGRGGVSILSNIGLAELVAQDVEQYVRIAVECARDLPRLSYLRETLRPRMQQSPLMDAPRFARHVEAAYRDMWRRWCSHP